MMPENDWYGHKLALAWYAGYAHPKPIYGNLLHGYAPDMTSAERRLTFVPVFVWNERHLAQGRALGGQNLQCIGAPFTYLARTMWPDHQYPRGEGTLVFPYHSSDGIHVEWDGRQLIREVEAQCEAPYTVSVFYQELSDPKTDLYREAGWRIVSFGRRDNPAFLLQLAGELARHEHVVGNVMQTGLLYGALLGRSVRVLGPEGVLEGSSGTHRGIQTAAQRWPELHQAGLSGEHAQALGREELGWNANLAPQQLKEALGWTSATKLAQSHAMARALDLKFGRGLRRGNVNRPASTRAATAPTGLRP